MLIIPIEHKPDWQHPPVATIVLILINILVFTFYQSHDKDVLDEAVRYYTNSPLAENERHIIEDILADDRSELAKSVAQQISHPEYVQSLAYYAFFQTKVDEQVRNEWHVTSPPNEDWMAQRNKFEEMRQSYSSLAFGLKPTNTSPIKYITSTFLHGSWSHLVGNMIFLFLFGFLIELALGAWAYLVIYCVTGIVAGFFFVLFNPGSYLPLVGASGAVSGLMGAYIVMYGWQRLKFFYTIGFYFGEFTAPALAILPLWLIKEIFGHLYSQDQVAYIAHFGGLIMGALTMTGVKTGYKIFKPESTFEQKLQDTNTTPTVESERNKRVLNEISRMTERLEFDGAKQRCKSYLGVHPQDLDVWQAYFNLEKLNPTNPSFHQTTFNMLKQALLTPEMFKRHCSDLAQMTNEYLDISKHAAIFKSIPFTIRLIDRLIKHGEFSTGLRVLNLNSTQLENNPEAKSLYTAAEAYCLSVNDQQQARKYARLASAKTTD